jgi:tetratricopeptide (TPR) repeat protein
MPPPPAAVAPQTVNYEQAISRLKKILENDPDNYRAWVDLGNAYFDSNQPVESIEAYEKALALNASDANVITDLGTMYRKTRQFQKAVENYMKAMDLDPRHANSRFNLGVVLLHDLKDYGGAIDAWEEFLKVEPPGERSQSIRGMLEGLKAREAEAEAAQRALSGGGGPAPQAPSGEAGLAPTTPLPLPEEVMPKAPAGERASSSP